MIANLIRTCVLLTLAMAMPAAGQQAVFSSGPGKTSLIELYTSEGCSSCPPAEAWINSLGENPALWERFVPAAFHVDYWDRLGWKDRFAKPRFSDRQFAYRAEGLIASVYTPGIVVDGREYRQWFGIRKLPLASTEPGGTLAVEISPGGLATFDYTPPHKVTGPLVINVAVLGFDISSDVAAGENRGRTLEHDFVVLDFDTHPLVKGTDGRYQGQTRLELDRQAGRRAVATWVGTAPVSEVLQAAGGWVIRQ